MIVPTQYILNSKFDMELLTSSIELVTAEFPIFAFIFVKKYRPKSVKNSKVHTKRWVFSESRS